MTELKRCACGCGKLVKSRRSNAIYATSNCRVKALRKRERQEAAMLALPDVWHENFVQIGARYGADGMALQKALVDMAREHGGKASIDAMNIVGLVARLEKKAHA